MELAIKDKAILAHVIVDPDAWVAHALETVGEKAVTAKIEKYRAEYLTKKDLPDYKNRAERDAFELAQVEANKSIPTEEELYEAAIKVKAKEIMDSEYRIKAITELEAEQAI